LFGKALERSVARNRDILFSVYRAARKGDDSTNDYIKACHDDAVAGFPLLRRTAGLPASGIVN
jgi:hypothetical protein